MEKIDNNKISSWWLLVPTSFLYIITFFIPLITLLVMSFSRFESSVTTVGFYLDNYEKILKWNRSLRFALSVCTLAESIKNEA